MEQTLLHGKLLEDAWKTGEVGSHVCVCSGSGSGRPGRRGEATGGDLMYGAYSQCTETAGRVSKTAGVLGVLPPDPDKLVYNIKRWRWRCDIDIDMPGVGFIIRERL